MFGEIRPDFIVVKKGWILSGQIRTDFTFSIRLQEVGGQRQKIIGKTFDFDQSSTITSVL
jgi:hypothetical protein